MAFNFNAWVPASPILTGFSGETSWRRPLWPCPGQPVGSWQSASGCYRGVLATMSWHRFLTVSQCQGVIPAAPALSGPKILWFMRPLHMSLPHGRTLGHVGTAARTGYRIYTYVNTDRPADQTSGSWPLWDRIYGNVSVTVSAFPPKNNSSQL